MTKEAKNPSDEALEAKGERTGKAVGPDVDKSFHVYEFDEPKAEEAPKESKK